MQQCSLCVYFAASRGLQLCFFVRSCWTEGRLDTVLNMLTFTKYCVHSHKNSIPTELFTWLIKMNIPLIFPLICNLAYSNVVYHITIWQGKGKAFIQHISYLKGTQSAVQMSQVKVHCSLITKHASKGCTNINFQFQLDL